MLLVCKGQTTNKDLYAASKWHLLLPLLNTVYWTR